MKFGMGTEQTTKLTQKYQSQSTKMTYVRPLYKQISTILNLTTLYSVSLALLARQQLIPTWEYLEDKDLTCGTTWDVHCCPRKGDQILVLKVSRNKLGLLGMPPIVPAEETYKSQS